MFPHEKLAKAVLLQACMDTCDSDHDVREDAINWLAGTNEKEWFEFWCRLADFKPAVDVEKAIAKSKEFLGYKVKEDASYKDLYEQGLTIAEIAKTSGFSRKSIESSLIASGVQFRSRSRRHRRLTEADKEQIKSEYRRNDREHSYRALAAKWGVSHMLIRNIVRG